MPLLASSWTVSEDGLTYSFKLQPDVKFQDGTPFDSTIVKFSLDRARAPGFDQCPEAVLRAHRPHRDTRSPDRRHQAEAPRRAVRLLARLGRCGDGDRRNRCRPTRPIRSAPARSSSRSGSAATGSCSSATPTIGRRASRSSTASPSASSAIRRRRRRHFAPAMSTPFRNFSAAELFGAFQKDDRFKTVIGATPRKLVAGINNDASRHSTMSGCARP